MSTKLNLHTFLSAATGASASGTYVLDYAYPTETPRTIFGRLDGGAEVNLWAYPDPSDETVGVLVSTFTASAFAAVMHGPAAKIKVEKVGATGTVWVKGVI